MLSLIKIGKHFLDKIVDVFFLKDLLKTSLIKKLVWIIVKIWHASCEILKFHFPAQTELFYRQKSKYSNSLNFFEMLLGFFLSSMSLSPTGGKIQIFTTSYRIFTIIHSRYFYILRLYARWTYNMYFYFHNPNWKMSIISGEAWKHCWKSGS